MAATLEDVIQRLKAEGQLTRNTGTNSIKSVSSKIETLKPIFESIKTNLEIQTKTLQEFLETKRRDEGLASVSGDATPSDQPPANPPEDEKPKKSKEKDFDFFSNKMLLLAGGLTAAAGIAIGAIKGQFNAIKAYFKFFTPNLFKSFSILRGDLIYMRVVAQEIFENAITTLRNMFNFGGQSKVGQVFAAFTRIFDALIEPFRVAITAITDIVTNVRSGTNIVTTTLGRIGGFLKAIGGVFTGMVRLVGKLFAPIAVIMTAIDTVKGAIQGYADGGIFGAVKGAIDGFFTSLVTVPLDLIKDLVAWVLGKLGFDESSEALKSFSFTELFKSMTSGIFNFLSDFVDWVKLIFSDPVAALKQYWSGLVGEGGVLDILWTPISLVIDWVTKKFGWRDEDAPTFNLLSYIKDVWNNVKNTVVEKFQSLADFVTTIPDRVKLFAEGMFINVSEKLKIGFTTLGAWISSIPARIKLLALNAIRSATSGLPEWAQIVSEEDVTAAAESVNARDRDLDNSITDIRREAALARRNLLARQDQFDRIQNAASNAAAPTVIIQGGPVSTNIQQSNRSGGSVQQNNISGGSSDLDYGLPSGPR